MSVPQKKKKADVIDATRVWLQIYSIVLEAVKDDIQSLPQTAHVPHTLAASAANIILKEVDLGD